MIVEKKHVGFDCKDDYGNQQKLKKNIHFEYIRERIQLGHSEI